MAASMIFGALLSWAAWLVTNNLLVCTFCLSVFLGRFLLDNCRLQREERERCDEMGRLEQQYAELLISVKMLGNVVAGLEDRYRQAGCDAPSRGRSVSVDSARERPFHERPASME